MSFERWLASEFARRKSVNSRYSIRAFARTLSADPGSVSQVLRGLRRASQNQVAAWCGRLNVPSSERAVYMALAIEDAAPKVQAATRLHLWAEDMIALTQEPAHFALLTDARDTGGATSLAELARSCGCTMDALHMAMSRLLRLGWLAMPAAGQRRDDTGIPKMTKRAFSEFVERKSKTIMAEFGV